MTLFDELNQAEDGDVIEIPDTPEGRIAVFLHRWHWRGERAIVTAELEDLIAWAKEQA